MSDEIKPAIMRQEWVPVSNRVMIEGRGIDAGKISIDVFGNGNGGDVVIWSATTGRKELAAIVGDPATKHAAVAAFNAALPDTDARKITREDLEFVEAGYEDCHTPESRAFTVRLAAKLAAILPPDAQ